MKAIDLAGNSLTLAEALELAGEDNVVLRAPDGRQFVLAEIDDFAEEIGKVCQNEALMQLLRERSAEPAKLTLSQVREQLQGKQGGQKKGRTKKGTP